MDALEHLSPEERAEIDEAVYASYGRMVHGAPPPPGSVTIRAESREDFRRQFNELFPPEGEQGAPSSDADPVRGRGAEGGTPPSS